MKAKLISAITCTFMMLCLNLATDGQIGVNSTGALPDGSAMLDVNSNNRGVLLPRIALTSADAASPVSSPAIGLIVYNTSGSGTGLNQVCPGFYAWNGLRWIRLHDGINCGYMMLPNNCYGGTSIPCNPYSTITDIDGNNYATVIIGSQEWMAENLKVTKYNNGDAIPNVVSNTTWGGLSTGAYCWHDNSQADFNTYGGLYNCYAINDSRGLCPAGFHVPTDAEWTTLKAFLDPTNIDIGGGKIKECGTTHWWSPNTDATNQTCFSALPGGMRDLNGTFGIAEAEGYWWSSTTYNSSNSYIRGLYYDWAGIYADYANFRYGFSVRCVR